MWGCYISSKRTHVGSNFKFIQLMMKWLIDNRSSNLWEILATGVTVYFVLGPWYRYTIQYFKALLPNWRVTVGYVIWGRTLIQLKVAVSLTNTWLFWWPPVESHYNIYGHSAVGYATHTHCIVLLYSVGNKITITKYPVLIINPIVKIRRL